MSEADELRNLIDSLLPAMETAEISGKRANTEFTKASLSLMMATQQLSDMLMDLKSYEDALKEIIEGMNVVFAQSLSHNVSQALTFFIATKNAVGDYIKVVILSIEQLRDLTGTILSNGEEGVRGVAESFFEAVQNIIVYRNSL